MRARADRFRIAYNLRTRDIVLEVPNKSPFIVSVYAHEKVKGYWVAIGAPFLLRSSQPINAKSLGGELEVRRAIEKAWQRWWSL